MSDISVTIGQRETYQVNLGQGILPHGLSHAPGGSDTLEEYYYPRSNPSGYITGVDLSNYSTISYVTGISGYLQFQISSIDTSSTGEFLTTGAGDSRYYPLSSNPSSYLVAADISDLASTSYVTGVSGYLQSQIAEIIDGTGSFITGIDLSAYQTVVASTGISGYLQTQISAIDLSSLESATGNLDVRVSAIENVSGDFALKVNTGAFLTTGAGDSRYYPLSSNPSSYLVAVDINHLASTGYVTGVSGYLQSQITSINNGTGNFVTSSQTGQFYPINNPSGYITGVDLSPYQTIESSTGISGYLQIQINNIDLSNLESATGNLDVRVSAIESITGDFAASSNTGSFLTTGAADNRYVDVLGDTVSGNLVVTGSTSGQSFVLQQNGYIDFQGGAPSHREGRVFYDTDAHTLCYFNDEADVTVNIGQEQLVRVSNGWTDTIENGRVVYASGAQGNRPKVYPASARDSNVLRHDVLGVATHDINSQGYITTAGLVNGLNTTGFSEGDTVYLSLESGLFSAEMPFAPNHAIKVGIITRSHQTQGQLFVDIDQGSHLDYLHDVRITGVQNNDLFRYNLASGYWENFQSNFATGDVVRPNETGDFLVSSDLSNYQTIIGSTGISGYLQGQISSLDSRVTSLESVSPPPPPPDPSDYFLNGAEFDISNGILSLYVSDGSVVTQSLDGRYATGSVVRPSETGQFYPTDNPSGYTTTGFVTGASGHLQIQITAINNETGNFVTSSQTGQFYTIDNPSGFVTGVDLSNYATTPFVTGISGYLQDQIASIDLSSLQAATFDLNVRLVEVENLTGDFITTGTSGYFQSQITNNYNSSITGIDVVGSDTKTITLYQQDGETLFASFSDLQSTGESSSLSYQEIYIDAGAMTTGISGASSTGIYIGSADVSFDAYSFGAGANSFSQFKMVLPSNWSTGDMKAKFHWTALNGSTGHVRWGIQSRAVGDDDAISGEWGTSQEVVSQFITGFDNHVTTATSQISFSNSALPEDSLYFRVIRNADDATDTFGLSSYLKGVSIQYKISGASTQW